MIQDLIYGGKTQSDQTQSRRVRILEDTKLATPPSSLNNPKIANMKAKGHNGNTFLINFLTISR
jgi:hypothetical protein